MKKNQSYRYTKTSAKLNWKSKKSHVVLEAKKWIVVGKRALTPRFEFYLSNHNWKHKNSRFWSSGNLTFQNFLKIRILRTSLRMNLHLRNDSGNREGKIPNTWWIHRITRSNMIKLESLLDSCSRSHELISEMMDADDKQRVPILDRSNKISTKFELHFKT